jgi:hypothetical protein
MRNKLSPYHNLLNEVLDEIEGEGDVSSFEEPPMHWFEVEVENTYSDHPSTDYNYVLAHDEEEAHKKVTRRGRLSINARMVAKHPYLEESVEENEDSGDVSSFDAPVGLEGQRVMVAVPDENDPEADAMYGKGYNGLTGEITEEVPAPTLPGIDRTDEQWFMVYLDDGHEESKYLMLPRRWFKVLDRDEQEGDVSSFPKPDVGHVGERVRIDVPKDERDVYDDWHGLKGTIIGDLSDPNDFYRRQVWKDKTEGLVFEPDKDMDGGNILVPREWLKPLLSKTKEVIEEEGPGNVSGLPEPGSRYKQAAREMNELDYRATVKYYPPKNGRDGLHYLEVREVLSPTSLRTDLKKLGYEVYGFDQSSSVVPGVGWRFTCALSLKDPDDSERYIESTDPLIGKVVAWKTLRGESHRGPIVELDGNVAYVDCEICGKQIAVEDGAYDFKEEVKSKVKRTDPKFMKAFYHVYLENSRYGLKDLPGFPEGLDLESCDIVSMGSDYIQFEGGGDWQNPVSFSLVVSSAGEPRIAGVYESICKTPKKEISAYIKQVEELVGAKKESRMTYRDILRETRLNENAEDIAQDLSQMQGQPVESPIPPPPDALPAPAPTPQKDPASQDAQVQALFTKYFPSMGTPGAVQQISKDLGLPYAAAHAMVTNYLSQFSESTPYDRDWSEPMPGDRVNLVSTEMAPPDKPGVNILAGNDPNIHADSEFDLSEYNRIDAYHKRKPYGESVEEIEGHGDVSSFPKSHYESGDRVAIHIPDALFSDLDADTQRLQGRSGIIQEHESADENYTKEERVLVLLGEENGRFEWIPIEWVRFLDPIDEAVEEEDFGDISDYEKPGWRVYYVDYVMYQRHSNEYHHAKFAAPDDKAALETVITDFTGSEEWKDDFEGYDEDTMEDLLNEFSNSDMDIIEIYAADGDHLLYRGSGSSDSFDDDTDTMQDDDWEEGDE